MLSWPRVIAKVLSYVEEVIPPAPALTTMGSCPDYGGAMEREDGCMVSRDCGLSRF
ncbi:MAG: hypothetical protein ACYC6G_00765 [Desulfobaccales bacterium]